MKIHLTLLSILCILSLISSTYQTIVPIGPHNFPMVKNDKTVWVVKFSSKNCGSCKEFLKTYEAVTKSMPNIKYGVSYIDDNQGLDLAAKQGVLDHGLPCVVIFDKLGGDYSVVVAGEVMIKTEYFGKLRKYTKTLEIGEDNMFKKMIETKSDNNNKENKEDKENKENKEDEGKIDL